MAELVKARFHCTFCLASFTMTPGSHVRCVRCPGIMVKWLNYEEWAASNIPERAKGEY